jgi:hypothetical protein
MQDTTLYQYLLGLQSPWTVSHVNLDQLVIPRSLLRGASGNVSQSCQNPELATLTRLTTGRRLSGG